MITPPPHTTDEAHRLETLASLCVLDTPAEDRFDRITRLAQRVFDVPIALVSLVDASREWFKSCQGLLTYEIPRNISFCEHALLQKGCTVITDTLKDPRFENNPLVTGEADVRMPLCGLQAEIDHQRKVVGRFP